MNVNKSLLAMPLYYLFILSLVTQIHYNYMFIANFIYIAILFYQCITNRLVLRNGKLTFILCISFIAWTMLSTLIFSISYKIPISSRNIIQLLFNLQYFVFVFPLALEKSKFENIFIKISFMYSLYIILVYFLGGHFRTFKYLFMNRGWIDPYIFVNCTLVFIPLLYGLYYSYKKTTVFNFNKIIFYFSMLLSTSRGALVGGVLLFFYYINKRKMNIKRLMFVASGFVLLLIIFYLYIPSLRERFFYFGDRNDLLNVSYQYMRYSPLYGMGGNTLEQIKDIKEFKITATSQFSLDHTHNWILEITLRYGLIGIVLFMLFLCSVYHDIKGKDAKYVFIIMLFLALFQTYIRNFIFIYLLSTLLPMKDKHDILQIMNQDSNIKKLNITIK